MSVIPSTNSGMGPRGPHRTRYYPDVPQPAPAGLADLGKPDLVELARERGLPVSGSKLDLIERLEADSQEPESEPDETAEAAVATESEDQN